MNADFERITSFNTLKIDKQYITIIASGHSIEKVQPEEWDILLDKTFVITMNYGPVKLRSHANIWSDKKVTEWFIERQKTIPKDRIYISRMEAFNNNTKHFIPQLDLKFHVKTDKLQGCYTLVYLSMLIDKYFPDKKVLVFGHDMIEPYGNQKILKFYDNYTDHDKRGRGQTTSMAGKHIQCEQQLAKGIIHKNNFFNCNLESKSTVFEKKQWKEIL